MTEELIETAQRYKQKPDKELGNEVIRLKLLRD
jgi:hypothetical protein